MRESITGPVALSRVYLLDGLANLKLSWIEAAQFVVKVLAGKEVFSHIPFLRLSDGAVHGHLLLERSYAIREL